MTPRARDLCSTLGIRYPIIQSGMSRVAGPELVAAVSNAGGLGILAALRLEPAELRAQIHRIRQLTGKPFGVNLWLHPAVVNPIAPESVDVQTLTRAQHTLNDIRTHLGLPSSTATPRQFPDLVQKNFDVILDERVPVWSIGLGNPGRDMTARCHDRGIRVMAMVTNVEDARAIADAGVDFVVAQGTEAGGHRSNWETPGRSATDEASTMVVVPRIVGGVRVPVIAAGGIVDGRGLVAALALGAAGVLLGTRFIATKESIAPQYFKDAVLAAKPGDTVVSRAFTGLPMRTLRNAFVRDYGDAPVLPPLLQSSVTEDIFAAGAKRGDGEYASMPAGESAALIGDLPSAADVVRAIASEADAVVRELGRM